MSETVSERIVVDGDPDTVMDVIADVEAYPQWQDEVRSVEVLESDEHGWATRARFVVDAKVTTATYVLAYTYSDTAMRWTLVDSDQLLRNDGAYELRDRGDGTTDVAYTLDLEPAVPVPALLRRQLTRRIVDTALGGLKRRAEGRWGRRPGG